jgi:hypothetical protein
MRPNFSLPHLPTLKLWRRILKLSRQLPKAERNYYRDYAHSHFYGHRDEIEEDRVIFIIEKSCGHIEYIKEKYNLKE